MKSVLVVAIVFVLGARAEAQGVQSDSILLGQPAAFSGSSAGLGIELWRGMSARVKELNDAGGINGRRVELALCDDKYDPETSAKCAVDLVTSRQVFLLTNTVGTAMMVRLIPLLEAWANDDVMVFGNSTGASPQRSMPAAPHVFNVRASYAKEMAVHVQSCVRAGKKNIGTFVQDDAYGKDGEEGVRLAVKGTGATLAITTSYKRGTKSNVDLRDHIKLLRDAKVDCVSTTGNYHALAAFIRAARGENWDVPIFMASHTGAEQLSALLNAAKVSTDRLAMTQVVPHIDDTTVPLVREYRAAMDKYKPMMPVGIGDGLYTPSSAYSFGSLEGYLNTKLLGVALAKAGTDLTRASFRAALESINAYDVGLVNEKVTFGPVTSAENVRNHQALQSVWLTRAQGTHWVQVKDVEAMAKQLTGK